MGEQRSAEATQVKCGDIWCPCARGGECLIRKYAPEALVSASAPDTAERCASDIWEGIDGMCFADVKARIERLVSASAPTCKWCGK